MYYFNELNQTLWISAVALLIIWLISKYLEYSKLPPGPFGLPIVGYLPFLTKNAHLTFVELTKKYGDVFSLNMGLARTIIINDYEIFKKTVNNPAAYSRPKNFAKIVSGGGIVGLNGKKWLEERRFIFTAMKDLGMGRGIWETMIHDSTQEFVKEIKDTKGKPIYFGEIVEFSQMKNILSLLFGKKMFENKNDPNFFIFEKFANGIVPFLNSSSLTNNAPGFVKILRKLKIGGYDEFFQTIDDFSTFVGQEIRNHLKQSKFDTNASFIDHYLQQYINEKQEEKDIDTIVDSMVGNMAALFLGSVDTTKAAVQWLLLLVAAFPEIQKRIHQEIDEINGKYRLIYWDERNNLPYTCATINEMQRWVTIAPLMPPRWTTEVMEVGKYIIPKGTIIIGNNWGMMHDSKYHEDPNDFKPERFLKSSNKKIDKLNSFLPFSTGKRNCPGEHVAMMSTFLYFLAIMQKFKIVPPERKHIILEDGGESAVRHPVSQELCFIER